MRTALCCASLVLSLATVLAGQATSSAEAWRGLSVEGRRLFVFGYKQGTFDGMRMASLVAGDLRPRLEAEEALVRSLSVQQRRLARQAREAQYAELNMESFEFRTVAATMTALYDDPANSLINFPTMLIIALKRLHGDQQSSIDRALEMARKAGARRAAELKE
jgi:hypothetical protein